MYATLFLALTIGQPLEALPLPPGTELAGLPQPPGAIELPTTKDSKKNPGKAPEVYPSYGAGVAIARSAGKPFVVFVKTTPRHVPGTVVVDDELHDYTAKGIVVFDSRLRWAATLPSNATDTQIRHAAGVERQVQAAPSFFVPEAATADDSPWLSRAETDRIKAAWPMELAFPAGLRFYSLPRLYQQLYTMNGGRSKFNVPTALEDGSLGIYVDDDPNNFLPLSVSGGMANIDQSLWQSFKGFELPGKIKVWKEDTDVRAYALTPRWRWQFPVGTVAWDVLVANGKVFEARTQVRTADGWETKIVHKNAATAPSGYHGAGQACASCHNRAGQIVDVPRQIYRHAIWGDDGRFSWRPFTEDGTIDRRWPVVEVE